MAGKTAVLKVSILGDAKGAMSAMSEAEQGAKAFESTMDKAAVGATISLAAIGAGTKLAVDAASELQQSQGAVSAIFGENAAAITAIGSDAATRLGLAQSEYGNLTSLLGSQLKNMGVAADELVPKTDQLVSLGADLAATYGGTTAEAVAAVSSLLKGERDPIERYGVSIKQVEIEAQKAAMGLTGLEGEAAKNADTQATLALLYNQTASAQGMFASEADTAAGAAARSNAAWQDSLATLGTALLPLVTEVTTALGGMATWAAANTGPITAFAAGIAIVAAAILTISAAMKVYQAVQTVQTAIQWAQNAAWLASPITWIVLAVIALIALIIVLWMNWDQVWQWIRAAAEAVAVWFGEVWQGIVDWFSAIWQGIADWWNGLWAGMGAFAAAIGDGVGAAFEAVGAWLGSIIDGVASWWNGVWQGIGDFIAGIVDGITTTWDNAMNGIKSLVDGVGNFINGIFQGIGDFIDGILGGIKDVIDWGGSLLGFSIGVQPTMLDGDIPSILTLAAAATPAALTFAQTPLRQLVSDAGALGGRAAGTTVAPTVVNVTIEGALDPNAVGKQVRDILTRYDALTGAKP